MEVGLDVPVPFEAVAYTADKTQVISNPKWRWEFGDGRKSAKNPTGHAYGGEGVYTATVTASTKDGTGTASATVTVVGEPTMLAGTTTNPVITQPGDGSVVCQPVNLRVAAARPDVIAVMSVSVSCHELAQGGHPPGIDEQCKPGGALTRDQQNPDDWIGGWFPASNKWGHNGSWELTGLVLYMVPYPGHFPPYRFVLIGTPVVHVTVANTVLTATCDASPPGLPPEAGVLAIDSTATGASFAAPRITWAIAGIRSAASIQNFTITIREMVSGQVVRTANVTTEARESVPLFGSLVGSWVWDGRPDGAPPGASMTGLFTYTASVQFGNDSATTGSAYLSVGNVSGSPGAYNGTTLPLTLGYTLADGTDAGGHVPPSEEKWFVYNASSDNDAADRFSLVQQGAADTPGLGARAPVLQLPPLTGSPYWVVVLARDAHGSRTTDGDRDHQNRYALARGLSLSYRVTEVWPQESGRVFISDKLGEGYKWTPHLFEQGRRCQPHQPVAGEPDRNGRADVQALAQLSVTDADTTNDAATTNLPCGGVTVYFHPTDPDSATLWDPSPTGDDNDDPVGPGTMREVAAVALRRNVTPSGGGAPRDVAIAESTLEFTQQYSGDNYCVAASIYERPLTEADLVLSGTLEAWRIIYYERDRMFMKGSALAQPVAAAATEVYVDSTADFSTTAQIIIFDNANHDGASQTYTVTGIDAAAKKLTLDRPAGKAYSDFDVGGGYVGRPSGGYYDAIDTALLWGAFAQREAFVEFCQYPGEPFGVYPTVRWDGWAGTYNGFFDHRTEPNVVHFIDGMNDVGQLGKGDTSMTRPETIVFALYNGTNASLRECLVHECGHQFGLTHINEGHPAHKNQDNTDGCAMAYETDVPPNDWDNGIALFGGVINPPDEPCDLKFLCSHGLRSAPAP